MTEAREGSDIANATDEGATKDHWPRKLRFFTNWISDSRDPDDARADGPAALANDKPSTTPPAERLKMKTLANGWFFTDEDRYNPCLMW